MNTLRDEEFVNLGEVLEIFKEMSPNDTEYVEKYYKPMYIKLLELKVKVKDVLKDGDE